MKCEDFRITVARVMVNGFSRVCTDRQEEIEIGSAVSIGQTNFREQMMPMLT